MYKKITHKIVEEHFADPSVVLASMRPRTLAKPNENEEDVIRVTVPLMIRLLEWAKEEALQDVELHTIAENLVDLSEEGDVLEMKDYPEIVQIETED